MNMVDSAVIAYTALRRNHPYEQTYQGAMRDLRLLRFAAFLPAGLTAGGALVFSLVTLVHPHQTGESGIWALLILGMWVLAVLCGVSAGVAWRSGQQLAQRMGALRTQYDIAVQIDDLKDQFIASVNHELRNPIMAMMGYLDIIDISLVQNKLDLVGGYVARAVNAGYRLRELINSILDTSREDQSASNFVPTIVNVRETLDAAMMLLHPKLCDDLRTTLTLRLPDDLTIWGDAVRLRRIFANLLTNAVKYSPPGAPVEFAASVIPIPAKGRKESVQYLVEIVVRDHGFGIPPNQISLLFNRFVRLPRDLTSGTIGNGLGLHLCKVLTEAMDGAIWVESEGIVGDGSTFHVLLPTPPSAISPTS